MDEETTKQNQAQDFDGQVVEVFQVQIPPRETGPYDDVTEPLRNGDRLPNHPALTTARKVVAYGEVFDDANGTPLQGGLHNNEIAMLMGGEQGALRHLYRYAIRDRRFYHTRPLAIVSVRTEDVLESDPCQPTASANK